MQHVACFMWVCVTELQTLNVEVITSELPSSLTYAMTHTLFFTTFFPLFSRHHWVLPACCLGSQFSLCICPRLSQNDKRQKLFLGNFLAMMWHCMGTITVSNGWNAIRAVQEACRVRLQLQLTEKSRRQTDREEKKENPREKERIKNEKWRMTESDLKKVKEKKDKSSSGDRGFF